MSGGGEGGQVVAGYGRGALHLETRSLLVF